MKNKTFAVVTVLTAVLLSAATNLFLLQNSQNKEWVTAEYTYRLVENTRTDLGADGSSTADMDLIRATLLVGGENVGEMISLRTVLDVNENNGTTEEERFAVSVLDLADGTIHVQTLYEGILGQPTAGHDEVAIIGGTGAYAGARGEMSWILTDSGDRMLKLHYTLD